MMTSLSDMLKMVEKLEELPTNHIEPLVYINPSVNIWREDEATEEISTGMALSNAPDVHENFFNVARVIHLNNKQV
jgi:aspartyl-tRNA(Asn)/glutamyl-tRNA(Gln) amidotransferase subunit C